ncbi:hypothetical protein ACVWXM_009930 [Bradyrhizobium sp. GM7.3]
MASEVRTHRLESSGRPAIRDAAHDRRCPDRACNRAPRDQELRRHPQDGASQWAISCDGTADMARLRPAAHRLKSFKFSTGADFVPKFRDIVALYVAGLSAPCGSLSSRKSRRSHPMSHMRPRRARCRRHDYNAMPLHHCLPPSTLPSAASSASAIAIAHRGSVSFSVRSKPLFQTIWTVHLVLDDYAAHKAGLIRSWLAKTKLASSNKFIVSPSATSIGVRRRYVPKFVSFIEHHDADSGHYNGSNERRTSQRDRTRLRLQSVSQGLNSTNLLFRTTRFHHRSTPASNFEIGFSRP